MQRVDIAVTGIGVVAPTGVSLPAFRAALLEGRTAIAPGPDGFLRAPVGDFAAKRWISPGALRRMPRLVQMAIVAAKQALADAAGVTLPADGPLLEATKAPTEALGLDPARVGAVLGTGLGTFDQTMEFLLGYLEGGPEAASPLLFPTSVMNAAAGLLAVECGLRGVNSTINHKDSSPLLAIGMAMDQLRIGRADAIVVGALDELCDPILLGYQLLGGLSRQAMRPYDRARSGLGLGESAALLVLERLPEARARGRRVHAVLPYRAETAEDRPRVGWGEGRAGKEAIRVVREAIAEADAIDWIAGSGNGTRLDELELSALAQGFEGRAVPPISSILSQTGESAASALLRVCAAIIACQEGFIPGTLGLEQPIAELPLLRAPQRRPVRRVLVPSFGQGGSNCALVVERAD
jgi:3-oxoacyl-[acyl-carrier-protein] synthase II